MLDILLTIVLAIVVLGILIFIHEGGHYVSSRIFGVRVTEFMLGLPGPSVGFTIGETRFGVTCIPLGGYARVCGMESSKLSPSLQPVLAAMYRRGTANMEDIALDCGISNDDAYDALEQLVDWGSILPPTKQDKYNTYRTPAFTPSRKQIKAAKNGAALVSASSYEEGSPRTVDDPQALFESEYHQQYCSLPFWKRSIILLAGIAINLLFAIIVFIVIYSIVGFDAQTQSGEIVHVTLNPLDSLQMGIWYIGSVIQAVIGLFNPATTTQVMSDSASIVGIAVLSREAAEMGAENFFSFMAMISVSLGIVNLVPIPPLDGGRFLVEIIQKCSRRIVPTRIVNYISMAGMALFLVFFVVMLNQDIQRFILGNWD